MSHRRIFLTFGAITLATPACGQTLDYGTLSSMFGEPVTTSATGTPQRATEVPATMTIITADEIRQSGARSIPQILERVPGLDILQTGSTVFDVGVRGYAQPFQPRLLVLVDGRQVFIDDYSRTIWENLPVNVDDIRQIEVVKGAASALFGSNAAGGVINIVTYNPLYDDETVATAGGGTQNAVTGDVTKILRESWGGTKLTVGGLTQDEFSTPRYISTTAGYPCCDEHPPLSPYHYYGADQTYWRITPNLDANAEFNYSKSVGNTADPTNLGVEGSQLAETWSARLRFNWSSPIGLISADNYYNDSAVHLYEPTDGGKPYGFLTGLFVSSLTDYFKIGDHNTFRLGLEYRRKTFDDTSEELFPQSPALGENNFAASATWLWQLTPSLLLTNAGRIDDQQIAQTGHLYPGLVSTVADYNHSNLAWSGNSSLVWHPTDADSLKAEIGHGVQLPSLIQSGGTNLQVFAGLLTDPEGNPRLHPTVVQDYSLDWSHALPALDSTLKLSGYYENNRDVIAPYNLVGTVTIANLPFYYFEAKNVGESHGYGSEIQLKGANASGLRWDVSYSFAKVDDADSFHNTGVSYQRSTPASHVRLWLGRSFGKWELDGNFQYLSGRSLLRSPNGGASQGLIPTPDYVKFGGRIAYALTKNLTLAVTGYNITTSNTLVASPYPALERQILGSITARY